jgi:hypothetical protein
MFFKHKKEPIFAINFYTDNTYDVSIQKKISSDYIYNIASFLHLLTYNSSICVDIINKIQHIKNNNNKEVIDTLLNNWLLIYLNDKDKPIINPLSTFQDNVRQT